MFGVKTKVGAGVIAIGSLGGLGFGINNLITTDSLENYLIKNGLSPIKESNTDEWKEILESYKLEKAGFEIDGEVNDENAIKLWCKSNLKKSINSTSDALFQKASKWCVEITTIENLLGGASGFEARPEKLKGRYSNIDSMIREQINKEIIDTTKRLSVDNELGEKIRQWCEKNKKRRAYENKKEEFFFVNIEKICLLGGN